MKKPLSILSLALGLLSLAPALKTPAGSECFLEAANGQQIDLSRLCGAPAGRVDKEPQVFQVPILRRVSGIPTVVVIFNDRHRYEMLFDTGSSGIVLTEPMAKAIGVKKEREIVAKTAGGRITAHLGRVSSVQAGGLTVENPVVSVSPRLEGMGLLGQTFFGGYDVTIRQDVIEFRSR
jgi:aspartyl protease family protein